MQCVIRPLARIAAFVVAGPYLLLASSFAPQHVHEPGPGHQYAQALAHSHFGPHAVEAHHDGQTEIEHDDDVVWLNNSVLNEHSYQAFPVPLFVARIADVVDEQQWSSIPAETSAAAHGPPKAAHLFRGPPYLA